MNLLTLLEPKLILAKQGALYGIVALGAGHFAARQIKPFSWQEGLPIEKAVQEIFSCWESLDGLEKGEYLLPVIGLGDLNTEISSTASLLLYNLSGVIKKQFSEIGLYSPFNVKTLAVGESGAIITSIMDIQPGRIVILGNEQPVIQSMNTVGGMLTHPDEPGYIVTLKEMLQEKNNLILGTELLIGGLGAVFTFEITFLYDEVTAYLAGRDFIGNLLSFNLSIFVFLLFLLYEIFEKQLFAFQVRWTRSLKLVSLFFFILFLLSAPIFIHQPLLIGYFFYYFRIISVILLAFRMVGDLGSVYFNMGLNKPVMFLLYFALLGLIVFFPMFVI